MKFQRRRYMAILATTCITLSNNVFAQSSGFDLSKVNTITTAVPFLRINNDTRSGGMGEVGIAIEPDAGGAQLNGAKMAFIDHDFGVNLSFTPWLKSLVDDIYLANLSGYYRIKNVQTIHATFRYFSLGNIQFKDENNQDIGQSRPQEMAVDLGYSRKLGKIFSLGLTLRFIYSALAPGAPSVGNTSGVIKPGIAGAADISWMVNKTFDDKKNSKMKHQLMAGMNISNLGSKITYTNNVTKDYIPANLGLGLGYSLHLDEKHTVSAYVDVNRLLVPTPVKKADLYVNGNSGAINPKYDKNQNGVADYREQSTMSGVFKSFGGAPTAEKMNENQVGVGVEYFYKKMFGVRGGYFYEHPTKGNRQFASVGATVKYSIVALHLSYLIPVTSQRNPLDNTFRFTLNFEFNKGGKKKDVQSTPTEPMQKELKPSQMQIQENNAN